jgi:hypothetical protein
MTIPSAIAAAKLLCCCDDDESPCDCGCEAGVCHGCCWGVGDLIDYEHDWTGDFDNRRTGSGGSPTSQTRNKCFRRSYSGSKVRVQYVFFGCIEGCEGYEGRFIYLFAPNLSPKGAGYDEIELKDCDGIGNATNWEQCSAGPCVRKALSTSECGGVSVVPVSGASETYQQYCLPELLGMFCESEQGEGDWEWRRVRIDPDTGVCTSISLLNCVDVCETCCTTEITNVDQLACNDPDFPIANYATTDCGACTTAVEDNSGPTFLGCKHCEDSVSDCGGYKGYCVFRMTDQECVLDGEHYGLYFNPPDAEFASCDCGCENSGNYSGAGAGGGYPSETCSVKACQTLTIVPTEEGQTRCKWHDDETLEEGGCCKKRKTATGGAEVVVPGDEGCPELGDWSFDPCGSVGPSCAGGCDCEDNRLTWGDLGCACPDCSGSTDPGWSGGAFDGPPMKTVCRSDPGGCP